MKIGFCFKKNVAEKVKKAFPAIFEKAGGKFSSDREGSVLLISTHLPLNKTETEVFRAYLKSFDPNDFLIIDLGYHSNEEDRMNLGSWHDNPFFFKTSTVTTLDFSGYKEVPKIVDVYKFQTGIDSYITYAGFTRDDARFNAIHSGHFVGYCVGKNIKCNCGGEFSLPKKQADKNICANPECAGIME